LEWGNDSMDGTPGYMAGEETLGPRLRALEARLARSEEHLADALQASQSWLWETDEELRFSRIVGPIEDILGTNPERLLGRHLHDTTLDRDDPRVSSHIEALERRLPYRDLVAPIPTRRGLRYIKASGKPLFDEDGTFRGYRGIASDVSGQVEAEHRAEATSRRFLEAIENVPASLMLCDAEHRIVICNSATQRYFPKVAHMLVPGTRFEDIVRALEQVRYPNKAPAEIEARVAQRMRRHREGFSHIIHAENGRWVQIIERRTSEGGTIGIRIDVTDLKIREQALDDKAKELERSNGELEQFAYVASHDLQEPLRMVASYCQLLGRRYKGKLDKDADEFIGFAVEGASRMQLLINDLLAYSRVGRGNRPLEPLALGDAVEGALANLTDAVAESGARIERAALPRVLGDRSQLTQLFQNLIGNAIKFRRDEPVVIRIAAEQDGAMWRVTVADNGIGIEADYVERVFQIFQRLHERGKYPGTGIGLAIAKKVVEHHGGRIWIESTPGAGSQFHFTLQAAPSAETRP
jgi:PAS domain S-box-containing protein